MTGGLPKLKQSDVQLTSKRNNPSNRTELRESETVYAVMPGRKTPKLFQGNGNTKLAILSSAEKINLLKKGVSKTELEQFKTVAQLDYDKLATALAVTRATLINKKSSELFNSSLSERIIDLVDIYATGYEVFGNKEAFNNWVFRSNTSLGGQVPFDIMDNQFGRAEIRDLIGRIATGVFS